MPLGAWQVLQCCFLIQDSRKFLLFCLSILVLISSYVLTFLLTEVIESFYGMKQCHFNILGLRSV